MTKYSLRFYRLTGANKGNLSHVETFDTFEAMLERYFSVYDPSAGAYNPTAWKGDSRYFVFELFKAKRELDAKSVTIRQQIAITKAMQLIQSHITFGEWERNSVYTFEQAIKRYTLKDILHVVGSLINWAFDKSEYKTLVDYMGTYSDAIIGLLRRYKLISDEEISQLYGFESLEDFEEYYKFCDECYEPMNAGFTSDDGSYYYCSEACMFKDGKYSWTEYVEDYENDVMYYTEWY